ncbi:MAG: DUF4445 domain-containing protein [Sedimentisphaerales bacterium]|nr:DUF4445 domain-containing protein [Sedimentisphaerales bacterium]
MNHFKIIFEPENKQIFIHEDAALLEAAGQAGIIINASCGGKGICKKCCVYIGPDRRKVLACQYKIHSDLIVTIPPESRYFEPKILEHGIAGKKEHSDICEKYRKTTGKRDIYGAAVDIGTTTVVVKLIDMAEGEIIATEAALNPQSQYGDDVISRITFAESDKKLQILQKTIIDCINNLIGKLCGKSSVNSDSIYELCAVGNTAMSHIFLGFPIAQLGLSPYHAYSLESCDLPADKMGLTINPAGNVHTAENIAGFVGSDTIAVALAADINSADQITLIIDIGTNGEIVLGTKDRLYAASCAAGPAFEGARIKCGSRATVGAIEAVIINKDDIDINVIGNSQARSICGSGLIDTAAVMLELGILEKSGRFADLETLRKKLPAEINKRLRQHNGELAFFLTEKVYISQSDIRQIQLAKAAVQAGIRLLLKQFNIQPCDIQHVLLAGAFGNYIRSHSALKIGLLPAIESGKIQFIGNAAASGSQMMLLSTENRRKASLLAQKIQYIELANSPDFQDVFADCIAF